MWERKRAGQRVIFVLILVVCFFALGGKLGPGAQAAYPLTVTDGLGREFVVEEAPKRIVTLAPSVTENIFALGAGDLVVGVSSYSDYPPEATAKPIVGDSFNLNFEQILLLEPDLIVGDAQVVRTHISKLEELGLPVFAINPTDLQSVMGDLLLLGKVVGREAKAKQVVSGMQAKIDEVVHLVGDIHGEDRPLVFVEVWDEPLMTCGPGSFMQELIELAGGRNLAEDARDAWVEYSEEQVLMRDPQVILLTRPYANEVLNRRAWQHVRAVVDGRVVEVDEDPFVRTTPRLADALVDLARTLHPDVFQ